MHDRPRFPLMIVATLAGLVTIVGCDAQPMGPAAEETGAVDAGTKIDALVASSPDGAGHPNVGLLAFDLDDGGPFPPIPVCSGFVVSDEVFLTAAHCIATAPAARWTVTLEPGSPTDPIATPGIYPDDFPFVLVVPALYSEEAVIHPRFGDGHVRAYDIAVVLFPEGTFAGVTPVELPAEGELDMLAAGGALLDQLFTLVGYGTIPLEGDVRRREAVGYRQVARAPFQGLTREWLVLQMTGEATDEGGFCDGDSGAPQLLGESNLALALLGGGLGSSGWCGAGVTRSQRLDTPAVRAFLETYIDID